jgi:hypothetical protein
MNKRTKSALALSLVTLVVIVTAVLLRGPCFVTEPDAPAPAGTP